MNTVRAGEDKRLTELTLNARRTIGDLTDKLVGRSFLFHPFTPRELRFVVGRRRLWNTVLLLSSMPCSSHSPCASISANI